MKILILEMIMFYTFVHLKLGVLNVLKIFI